ncbi:nucleoside 2-deoxyribosyltransferase domain-containing protein [Aquimarina sp. 2201CG5-10]|uniref:nucleoside 2-deoxyribosyltransferase domain-containing protein n=1 Tax=Aquimarina callyspongiae TaxID=3098150 RepID=UPI002AB3C612|nr:nucleoside 2-deoxyribosyltransferase domain-containing protein [Aquimarina sp. 2201CG5-10]MDY8137759.1 nucleoside 2-deoxyribosyltransferase domain-containing protein [Aquimarina sp. 2201CG5-10]
MNIITAPTKIELDKNLNVFLAGSIEVGVAERWQDKVVKELSEANVTLLNPRRASWDSSWKQEIENPIFKEQVDWELDALELADIIIMYFDKETKSPITLLELGLFARSGKLLVCCPEGFWRKGNVDVVCERYKIPQVSSLEELINEVQKKLK